jgi:hypothetical protein
MMKRADDEYRTILEDVCATAAALSSSPFPRCIEMYFTAANCKASGAIVVMITSMKVRVE